KYVLASAGRRRISMALERFNELVVSSGDQHDRFRECRVRGLIRPEVIQRVVSAGPRANRHAGPSMQDVAEAAGVSLGTVSNVLNHPAKVGAATAQRVREAIDHLGFDR